MADRLTIAVSEHGQLFDDRHDRERARGLPGAGRPAVQAARDAFLTWSQTMPQERSLLLLRLADPL
jgi:hypothetical protein